MNLFQDELLSKKKKEKKKKLNSKPLEELRCIGQDRNDRYRKGILPTDLQFSIVDEESQSFRTSFVEKKQGIWKTRQVRRPRFNLLCCLFQSSGPTPLAGHPPAEAEHLGLPVHQKPAPHCPGMRDLISPGAVLVLFWSQSWSLCCRRQSSTMRIISR